MNNKFINYISYNIIPYLTGDSKKPNVYITNKNYLNWKQLNKSMNQSLKYINGICIDVGSGNSPYKNKVLNKVDEYIAVDRNNIHQHMFKSSKEKFIDADIKDLPFDNQSVDTIILTQVLEHIDEPFIALDEIKRILKKDGIFILSTPFIYQAHATPYDYFRFSEFELKKICKDYNFEILEFHYQGYVGTTIISILNGFLWEQFSKNKILRNTILLPLLLSIFICNNLIGLFLDLFKNKNYTPNFWMVLQKK